MTIDEAKNRFICNSAFVKNFNKLELGEGERAVMIVNALHPIIEVLNISGLNDDEVVELVNITSGIITSCCNYEYKITGRVDNVFFLN